MLKFKKLFNYFKYAKTSKLLVALAFVVLSGGLIANNMTHNAKPAVAASDCIHNSIIFCGFDSPQNFADKYRENAYGDLHTIYARFGLQPGDIDRFANTARPGLIYRNGDVTVDGRLVATNSSTIGRDPQPGSSNLDIGGVNYFLTPNDRVFLSDPIPVMVMMSGDHIDFIVMQACGNPAFFTQPNFSCDMLNTQQLSRGTYRFSSKATANNGADVARVVYDFGDGTSETRNQPGDTVDHTYAQPGNYTARATVIFNVHGQTKTVTGEQCTKPVEVKPVPPQPRFDCTVLEVAKISRTKYEFVLTATAENGATLHGASFDFGDKATDKNVKPSDATHVKTSHEYTNPGNYTVKATALIDVNGETKEVTSDKCAVKITVPPEMCKPGIPVGSKECLPQTAECSALDFTKISRTKYEFTAKAALDNGATLESASFDFGDNSTAQGIKPIDANHVKVPHEYAQAGSYTIKTTLAVKLDGKTKEITSEKCAVKITVAPEECKPGIPVGSKECQPPVPPQTPPTPTPPTPNVPATLPSTGPTEIVGSTMGIGGVVAAGMHYVRARRGLRDTFRK
jgi:PKD repeat protein